MTHARLTHKKGSQRGTAETSVAGRKFGRQRKGNEKRTGVGLREEGPNTQNERNESAGRPDPSQRRGGPEARGRKEGGAGAPGQRQETPNSRGRQDGGAGSRGGGGRARLPVGATRGGARKDPGRPRRARYICSQSPGPPQSPSSDHNLSSRYRAAACAREAPTMAL